jgi:hypothetical protein
MKSTQAPPCLKLSPPTLRSPQRATSQRGPGAADGEWGHNAVEMGAVHDYLQVEDDEGVDFWPLHAGDGEDAWRVPDRVHPWEVRLPPQPYDRR